MASYGFRIFRIELREAKKRKPVDFSQCEGEHFISFVERALKGMSSDSRFGTPGDLLGGQENEAQQISLKKDDPAFRVEHVSRVGFTLRGAVFAGSVGSHHSALGATEDVDISDKAPSRPYRFVMAFPQAGDVGVIAVEDISRTCPVGPMKRWLRWESQRESIQKMNDDDLDSPPAWWNMIFNPMADEDRMDEMIKQGNAETLELVKRSIESSRTSKTEIYRVSAPIPGNKVRQVAQLVKSWIPSRIESEDPKSPVTDKDAAKQLASFVGPEIEDLDLNDGWVKIRDEVNRIQRVSPSRISEVFTYGQAPEGPIDTPSFYTEVRKVALRLQAAENLEIFWPES